MTPTVTEVSAIGFAGSVIKRKSLCMQPWICLVYMYLNQGRLHPTLLIQLTILLSDVSVSSLTDSGESVNKLVEYLTNLMDDQGPTCASVSAKR